VICCCSAHRFPKVVSGAFPCSGRLEIHNDIESGIVCDLDLDWNDARVVCAELQCGVAVSVRSGAYFGEGAGFVWNDRFECKGSETGLTDCTLVPVNRSGCTHRNDVSVICSGECRLVNIRKKNLNISSTER